jgi:L,D-transpeptidase YcbB
MLVLLIMFLMQGCAPSTFRKELSEKIREQIDLLNEETTEVEAVIYNPDMIARLYEKGSGLLSAKWDRRENIDQLLDFIHRVRFEGLCPEDYHLSRIERLIESIAASEPASMEDVARLELLLTDAYLTLSSHLAGGKTDRDTIDPRWHAAERELDIDWSSHLDRSLRDNLVAETLEQLIPIHGDYMNLKKALGRYLDIEATGGWEPFITVERKLERGMTHPDVPLLRQRIAITQGEIPVDTEDENLFDEALHDQVVIFQARNGLTEDGIVGLRTVEALNVPVEARIASIEINLERWRWLNRDLGERYIMVNIANFDLKLIENGTIIFDAEVIVGRPYRQTPVFSSTMTYLVLNPDWTIPPVILRNDVIPAVIANPGYLAEKRMKVLSRDGREIDPASIDWKGAVRSGFPYLIRQEPGPDNTLGRAKFMFPNQYNVYIHDTPARELFARTERTFSSGCIRVDRPLELAEHLLGDNAEWDDARIEQVVNQGRQRTVTLRRPVPVHLLYLTAWADEKGIVYFRRDIYERDPALLTALKQLHQTAARQASS